MYKQAVILLLMLFTASVSAALPAHYMQTIFNFLSPLNRLEMAFIDKPFAKAKIKYVITCGSGLHGNDLSGPNIPHRHHLVTNLRPDRELLRI